MRKRFILGLAIVGMLIGGSTIYADEYDTLRDKWKNVWTGGTGIVTTDPDIAAKIDLIELGVTNGCGAPPCAAGTGYWDTMDRSVGRTKLWSDLSSASISANLTTAYDRLKEMALAYTVTGSSLNGNVQLRDDIINGLDWMYANRYNRDAYNAVGEDNWWDWEIGAPLRLNDTVVIMYADLTPTQITNYMNAVNQFAPTTKGTGANLVWSATVVSVRGVIVKNGTKIGLGRDGISSELDYVTSSDGFYADGSFIQHAKHPCSGGYGKNMFKDVANMMYLLAGSNWEITDPDKVNIYKWAYDAFEPLIYKGAMMDMVRGRNISRDYSEDHTSGHDAMIPFIRLSLFAPPNDALAFKKMVKYWIQSDTYRSFYLDAPLEIVSLAKGIMNDSSIPSRGELTKYKQYPSMDRAVQLRPGFGFGISMHSNRIYNYESINNENTKAWHTGDGMTYLYNNDLNQFSDGYWPTVNPYRLPGTTVNANTTAASSKSSTKTWVGGAEHQGIYGATGMELKPDGKTLTAKKSWFMLDDEIVALGAGITSSDNAVVETIVENRKLNSSGSNALSVNGTAKSTALTWSETMTGVNTIHLAGSVSGADIGYYFPTASTIMGKREARTGTWKSINDRPSTPTTSITNNYVNFWFDHGNNPSNKTYSYVIMPGKSTSQLSTYASNPDVTILENSGDVQAVKEEGLHLVAANFWNDASKTVNVDGTGYLTSNKKASVLVSETNDQLALSVSDTTMSNTGTIQLEVHKPLGSTISLDPAISVIQSSPTLILSVNVNGSKGKTFHAVISKSGTGGGTGSEWNVIDDNLSNYANGWSVTGTTGSVTQNSGTVTVIDTGTAATGSYYYLTKNSFVPPTGAFTFETRLKSNAANTVNEIAVRSTLYQIPIFITHGTAGVVKDREVSPTKTYTLDTTIYHSYRVVVHANYTYDLYVDDALVWSGAVSDTAGTANLKLGGNNTNTANLTVDNFKMGNGEITPASQWDVVNESMNNTTGWTISGTTGSVTQNTGTVTVVDTGTGTTGSYYYLSKSGFTPPTGAFTLEFIAQINAANTMNDVIVRSANYLIPVYITYGTSGTVQNDRTSPFKTYTLDTTILHTYRAVVHSNSTYDLYVDGVLAWSGAVSVGTGSNALMIGGSNTPTANIVVDEVRVGNGELTY
ncbi:polysaccharide lyase family 8 super-sandwich domain-containing protein [Paenibacillus qinlingensis]|uniref:Hyaluronate lyase n=1 Tax=Paenibacillus qinlingensis TaxID=1837343 RepID=A0ABU1NV52_9BACL|nr:polysaccharide lyase family 8 super-sandwich domain-containing protein [Paenibacillus qinlingensis]MDR6550877.1 hypothetical protein [Paenibacillus qinlingensis]